jgi:hypothetical protein
MDMELDATRFDGTSVDGIKWVNETQHCRDSQIVESYEPLDALETTRFFNKHLTQRETSELLFGAPTTPGFDEALAERGFRFDGTNILKKKLTNTTSLRCWECGELIRAPFDMRFSGSIVSDVNLCSSQIVSYFINKDAPLTRENFYITRSDGTQLILRYRYCRIHGLPLLQINNDFKLIEDLSRRQKSHSTTAATLNFPLELVNEEGFLQHQINDEVVTLDTHREVKYHGNHLTPSGREIRVFLTCSANSDTKAKLEALLSEAPRDSNTHFRPDGTSYTPSVVIKTPTRRSRDRIGKSPRFFFGTRVNAKSRTTRLRKRAYRRQPCLKCKQAMCRCTISDISLQENVHYRMQYIPGFIARLRNLK